MTGVPAPTLYHRWLGWHAPAMRRALTAFIAGLIVAVVLLPFVTWGLAGVGGCDSAALTVLLTIWPIIIRADSSLAPQLAGREDETGGSARALLAGTSVASLLGAGYALHLAGRDSGAPRVLLISFAVLTVVLSGRHRHYLHPALCRPELRVKAGRHRVRHRRRPAASQLPRLRLRRVHHRHVLPGVRHDAARPSCPAHRARSRHLVLCVRRGHRRGLSQPHLRAVPLTLPDPPRDWQGPPRVRAQDVPFPPHSIASPGAALPPAGQARTPLLLVRRPNRQRPLHRPPRQHGRPEDPR